MYAVCESVRECKSVCAHLTKKSIEFSLIHIFTNSSKILMFSLRCEFGICLRVLQMYKICSLKF